MTNIHIILLKVIVVLFNIFPEDIVQDHTSEGKMY